jgi:hypothetical protein
LKKTDQEETSTETEDQEETNSECGIRNSEL